MADFGNPTFDQAGDRITGSSGFQPCSTCAGMGFVCRGPVIGRVFDRCSGCNGAGQIYLTSKGE